MKILKALGFLVVVAMLAVVAIENIQPEFWNRVEYPLEYKEEIKAASEKYDLDPFLVCAIIYVESKFEPSSKSRVGAVGLMQIMPETGQWAATKRGNSYTVDDLDNPSVNIDTGCWYFRYLLLKYKNEKLALAAYNSGFKNVDRWLVKSKDKTVDEIIASIPYKETRQFIDRVEGAQEIYRKTYAAEFVNNNAGNTQNDMN
jgi:soluble lytic murein transglycosylase